MTKERLSVHRRNCKRLKEIKFQREDAVDVVWKARDTVVKKTQVIYILEARRQRIMMITGVAPVDVVISELSVVSSIPTQTPAWQLAFKVVNLAVLQQVLKHFEKSGIRFEFEFDY